MAFKPHSYRRCWDELLAAAMCFHKIRFSSRPSLRFPPTRTFECTPAASWFRKYEEKRERERDRERWSRQSNYKAVSLLCVYAARWEERRRKEQWKPPPSLHTHTHTHTRPGGSSKRRRRRKILYTIHTGDNWELIHHRFDRCDVRASNPLLLTYTHTWARGTGRDDCTGRMIAISPSQTTVPLRNGSYSYGRLRPRAPSIEFYKCKA